LDKVELNTEQLADLLQFLQPEAGAGTQVGRGWTGKAIGQVIRERFGVSYRKSGVRKLLHLMGWSYQRGRKLYVRRRPEEQARFS
jgi:transposase